ncbi:methyltransferase, FxLD system [Planomonospora sp. ID82291]|uniref:methyltransferase, FxLD system n=1 Tax=Planomonospora sp. ID82291 TaxID=2738136 RepID=UPI0018C423EC|nr:methyltransferase, FxLD system [Planomonospora sp. ID82291]MBG0818647.1 methyltransferase, FxLD system [Planomonospora sp. ID82291]
MTTPRPLNTEVESRAAELREALVQRLRQQGFVRSDRVADAFTAVKRHWFAPEGTPLEQVYAADETVVIKQDGDGVIISSISAPFIQAQMIEQAEIGPGSSVLEIGSGGYNAALLTEVVGAQGRVVSVDIDPEVTDRASVLLDAAGYGSRVTVVLADAEHGVPACEPFDALVVTVGAWDIPPAWLKQLAADGRLVVPLRMNGITRSIGFRREGDHLVSTSAEVCGFVAMQGDGEHSDRIFRLPDGRGHHIGLRFDSGAPQDPGLLDGVLATERTTVWSGVTTEHGVSFADLHLWFASFLPGFCQVTADDGTDLAGERGTWFPYGVVRKNAFAYLVVRPALEGRGAEFGACAYGLPAAAQEAAAAMVEQIQEWDCRARSGPAPTFAFWPNGSDPARIPKDAVVLPKAHGLVTISWPGMS